MTARTPLTIEIQAPASTRINTTEAEHCRDCYDEGFAEGYLGTDLTGSTPAHLYGYQDGAKARADDLEARGSSLIIHDNIGPDRPITPVDEDDLDVEVVDAKLDDAVTAALRSPVRAVEDDEIEVVL